ncbi:MAG: PaaI family thioesterase [Ferrovibrio sp.]|nr:PaaI family thioesterase [Ferrovibrio sp.]
MAAAPLIDASLEAWKVTAARRLIETVPFHLWAGLTLLELSPGLCRLSFPASGDVLVVGGYVHGGILNGLLEPAAYGALITGLNESDHAVTVDIHVQHLRSIQQGAEVELTGRVVRRARALAFLEAEARVEGLLHTQARITKAITQLGPT